MALLKRKARFIAGGSSINEKITAQPGTKDKKAECKFVPIHRALVCQLAIRERFRLVARLLFHHLWYLSCHFSFKLPIVSFFSGLEWVTVQAEKLNVQRFSGNFLFRFLFFFKKKQFFQEKLFSERKHKPSWATLSRKVPSSSWSG